MTLDEVVADIQYVYGLDIAKACQEELQFQVPLTEDKILRVLVNVRRRKEGKFMASCIELASHTCNS